MKHWIKAFRLRTLPLSFSGILMATGLAISFKPSPFPEDYFGTKNWIIFGLTLFTTLLLQILSNLANDYGDAKKGADNDGRIGPERAIQSGAISAKQMLNAIIITAILALLSGVFLLFYALGEQMNWVFLAFLLLGIGAIAAAIKYTVGKKAYGYSGLGDVFVFIFFGLVSVIGGFYLQTGEFYPIVLLFAITIGCYSVAVLNLNNMRDRVNDQKVGKNTLVVKLGFKKSKIYHYILFVIAYSCAPLLLIYKAIETYNYLFLLPVVPVLILHLIHIIKVIKIEDPKDFDPELKKIALSAFLFSVLFFATVLYIH